MSTRSARWRRTGRGPRSRRSPGRSTETPRPRRPTWSSSFAPDGDGLGITGFGGSAGSGRVPLWMRGELSVARSRGVLVMVDGTRSEAAEVAARVTRGIDVVRRVLPAWRAPVVVEVPASAAALDETLGAPDGTYAGIAAVTATAGSATDGAAPVHVFVNPEVTAGLRRAGAQVVMSHELVHVATDAARSGAEPWLVEGFADYVALRDTDLPDEHHPRAGDRGRAPRRRAGRSAGCCRLRHARNGPPGTLRGGLARVSDHRRAAGGAGARGGLRRRRLGDVRDGGTGSAWTSDRPARRTLAGQARAARALAALLWGPRDHRRRPVSGRLQDRAGDAVRLPADPRHLMSRW